MAGPERARDPESRIVAGVLDGRKAPGLWPRHRGTAHDRHGAAWGKNIAYRCPTKHETPAACSTGALPPPRPESSRFR